LEETQVISLRSAPGEWTTADITTAHDEGPSTVAVGHSAEYKLFSSDLSLGVTEPEGSTPLPPLAAGSEKTIYLREGDGAYRALVTSANVAAGTKFGHHLVFDSASPDLRHVVLNSEVALHSADPTGGGLYEWAEGQLQLVSVLPGGEAAPGASLGRYSYGPVVRHAISDNGSRVVWKSGRHEYLRDVEREETVQVDAAQGGLPETTLETQYVTANSEGSRVFFTSGGHLTADSTLDAQLEDLYAFEVTSGKGEPLAGKLTDLTAPNGGEYAGVQGVIGASEDGSYVYFVAGGLLGDAAAHGAEGGHYLYVVHYDTSTNAWTAPQFIAALASGDSHTWGVEGAGLIGMTSRVSPNGRYLAFMSQQSLTGYENRDANSDAPDEEVFLYDASTGRVVCASCDPSGGRPVGLMVGTQLQQWLIDAQNLWANRWLAADIPGWTTKDLSNAIYQSRYLSDSGRLFFNSVDALVPADVNGKADVYEYEPAGVGGCQGPGYGQSASVVFSESVGGCIALISAGTSSGESAFMDASESGADVFFLTLSRLSASDYDTSLDMYDAHECTAAEPCAPAPALSPPPCATGDACKPAPTPQPTLFGAPSSETFSGAGNLVPTVAGPAVAKRSSGQAKKFATALRTCRKKAKSKRAACERRVRQRRAAQQARAHRSSPPRTRR
jgi:hypothetical protein